MQWHLATTTCSSISCSCCWYLCLSSPSMLMATSEPPFDTDDEDLASSCNSTEPTAKLIQCKFYNWNQYGTYHTSTTSAQPTVARLGRYSSLKYPVETFCYTAICQLKHLHVKFGIHTGKRRQGGRLGGWKCLATPFFFALAYMCAGLFLAIDLYTNISVLL